MIVIGIDPSNLGAAWAVLDCGGASGVRQYLDKGQGTLEDVCTLIAKHAGDARDLAARCMGGPLLVAVERPPAQLNIHARPGFNPAEQIKNLQQALYTARAKASALIDTAYMAGAISACARAAACRVVEMRPETWRAAIGAARKTKGTDQDALVKAAVRSLITGWPKRSNDHVRDAAGVGLAAYWQVRAERRASGA